MSSSGCVFSFMATEGGGRGIVTNTLVELGDMFHPTCTKTDGRGNCNQYDVASGDMLPPSFCEKSLYEITFPIHHHLGCSSAKRRACAAPVIKHKRNACAQPSAILFASFIAFRLHLLALTCFLLFSLDLTRLQKLQLQLHIHEVRLYENLDSAL